MSQTESPNLVQIAGVFFENLEVILKGYKRHADAGRAFPQDTNTILQQLSLSVYKATVEGAGSPPEGELLDAVTLFAAGAELPKITTKEDDITAVAAGFYNNITSILKYFYRLELDGDTLTDPAKSLLSQVAHAIRKVILTSKMELDRSNHEDAALGNALDRYVPKGAPAAPPPPKPKPEGKDD